MKRAEPIVWAPQIRCAVGEGPVEVGDMLYWVDIVDPRILRLDLTSGAVESWAMPEWTGFIVPRADRSDFIVGLKSGLHVFCPDPFNLIRMPGAEPLAAIDRFNDAKVDRDGCLWAGTMRADGAEAAGALNRVSKSGRLDPVDTGYLCPNGPAFGQDGTLYHADSTKGMVYRLTLAPDGALASKHIHIRFDDPDWGLPDGMTVDAEGCLWIAHWDGGRISRFDPDGALIEAWSLPASRITSCAFGGGGLDRLFITSAGHERDHEPDAGRLFEIHPGVCGVAATLFAG